MWNKIVRYPNSIILSSVAFCAIILMLMVSHRPPVICAVATGEKLVALTVDDGPDPRFTPQILEILREYGAKATFFVTGENAEKYPELLQMEVAYGCEIANHTYSHPDLKKISSREIREEISATNGIIFKHTGKDVKWFRPPFSSYDRKVVREARKLGLETVLWTCVVETPQIRDPEAMAHKVIERVKPGCIIIFHDSRLNRTSTVKALPIILEELGKQGYRFVTVSELLEGDGSSRNGLPL